MVLGYNKRVQATHWTMRALVAVSRGSAVPGAGVKSLDKFHSDAARPT
jgi:hypothetical protein